MAEKGELIESGADVEARDIVGPMPLFMAASHGHNLFCSALLDAKADHNNRDGHGHSIGEVAAKGGHLDIIKNLVACGADLDPFPMYCCSTPLQAATESQCVDLIISLLDHGVDVTAHRPYDRKTAMQIADERGLTDIVKIMQERACPHTSGFWPPIMPVLVDAFAEYFG